jgi:cytochrome P450
VTTADDLAARLDLTDAAFIADPYPALAALREAAPIVRFPATGQWLVTRFEDVHAALRDRRLGRAYRHRYSDEQFGRPAPDPRWQAFRDHDRWSLLELEPPDHTRIRQLISKVFTVRSVAALRPMIERTAGRLLDECRERGRFELLADFAQPYSVAIICAMLGVPADDGPALLAWSHSIVKWYELTVSDEQRAGANDAAAAFIDYVKAVIADKRAHPGSDLVSQLAVVEEDGARLSDDEIVSTVIVLLNAGHEATVNTLGNGMRAFVHHPVEWRAVTSGEVDARTAVEEMIRFDAPLQLFERWVLDEGVTIAGQPLAVGDEIVMLFGSANRDPRRFAEPDRFLAARGDTGHVTFGGGIHFCIGAPLARLELEISVAHLAAAGDLALAAEPRYHPTFVIRGLQALELSIG